MGAGSRKVAGNAPSSPEWMRLCACQTRVDTIGSGVCRRKHSHHKGWSGLYKSASEEDCAQTCCAIHVSQSRRSKPHGSMGKNIQACGGV